jgi:DNA end-binding protein Ku
MPPIWKGSLTFGLVHIPVLLQAAVRGSERVSFRQLHAADHAPIRLKRVCEAEGVEVPWEEIVKGYEYEKGRFVVLTADEIRSVALPSSKVIEILDFVEQEEVDPRYFDTPYYLLPQRGGEKPYALLREAVRETGMIGIGTVTLREGAHHLSAVRVVGDALVLALMRFAAELVDPAEYAFPPAAGVRPQELAMATQLVRNLAEAFEPSKYRDEYQEALRGLIERKLEGKEVSAAPVREPEGTPVVDLLARLKESVALGKAGLAGRGAAGGTPVHGPGDRAAAARGAGAKRSAPAAARAAGARPAGRKATTTATKGERSTRSRRRSA